MEKKLKKFHIKQFGRFVERNLKKYQPFSEVNKAWDALVWHDDEHVQEASTLLAKLENIGYRVCTKEDQTSGELRLKKEM